MKNFIILILPLAFIVGFIPFFLNQEDASFTNTTPSIQNEIEQVQSDIQNDIDFSKEVYDVQSLCIGIGGLSDYATKLSTEGISLVKIYNSNPL